MNRLRSGRRSGLLRLALPERSSACVSLRNCNIANLNIARRCSSRSRISSDGVAARFMAFLPAQCSGDRNLTDSMSRGNETRGTPKATTVRAALRAADAPEISRCRRRHSRASARSHCHVSLISSCRRNRRHPQARSPLLSVRCHGSPRPASGPPGAAREQARVCVVSSNRPAGGRECLRG